jgi:hypothetical protein
VRFRCLTYFPQRNLNRSPTSGYQLYISLLLFLQDSAFSSIKRMSAMVLKSASEETMNRESFPQPAPRVTIRVSGKLFQGHLAYLNQLVQSAEDCCLWPVLNLSQLEEVDRAALSYLVDGENRQFDIISCPNFIRDCMAHEKDRKVA